MEQLKNSRAVGIFDSGLGGLTAVKALRAALPDENIVYFADSGRVPYGGRAPAQLKRMARQDLDLVASFSVKAIIAACGTVSSTAPEVLESYPIKTFGVLEAAVRRMSVVPGRAPLAVIATQASIRAGCFQRRLAEFCPGRRVLALACPDFVPLIEGGHIRREDPLLRCGVEAALAPLKGAGISALLLGCTHYGIISDAIGDFLGAEVELVSAADCAAASLADYIVSSGLEGGEGRLLCLTSGSPAQFETSASALLGGAELHARQVPLMEVDER